MSNHQDQFVAAATGGISSMVMGGLLSMIGDVAMALVFGFVGALGGWVFKLVIAYVPIIWKLFIQKIRRWFATRL
jgi:hypothetical protein